MSGKSVSSAARPDLDSAERIRLFIEAFYARVLRDELLAPIFLDVARIDLDKHLPIIRGYWEKLILGSDSYRRHTMNIHRALHARQALDAAAFARWLTLFEQTLDDGFSGSHAERARRVARHIARNMQVALEVPAQNGR
jgi:hemoglobin